ncbi:MAG: hypothetical protein K2M97_07875, partial [Muribaculaceae bacterium]|nr:hypothetical protein [Muribaculaceae bacterium]
GADEPTVSDFRFTILRSDKSEVPSLSVVKQKVYLLNDKGLAFTYKGKSDFGAFEPVIEPTDNSQLFGITIDTTVNRCKITSVGGACQVNETGRIGYNAYSPDWNTYIISENGEKFAVATTGSAQRGYWIAPSAEGACFSIKDCTLDEAYTLRIVPFDQYSGITEVATDDHAGVSASGVIYDLAGRRVARPTSGFYIIDGHKVIL